METTPEAAGGFTGNPQEHPPKSSEYPHWNTRKAVDTSTGSRKNEKVHHPKRNHKPHRDQASEQARPNASHGRDSSKSVNAPTDATKSKSRRHKNNPITTSDDSHSLSASATNESGPSKPPTGAQRRGAKFNAGLTGPDLPSPTPAGPSTKQRNRAAIASKKPPEADDLTSRLIHSLTTPPYQDCLICLNAIRPMDRIWSCSPSIPIVTQPGEESQYCWTTFHVKCIGEWAAKSVKEIADAWRARGEEGRKGDWRCPWCQAKREVLPSGYWCFCHSTSEPKPPRLATPHSCAGPCSRVRESGCGHPCPLPCHPGPCPPCQVTTRMECYCPRQKIMALRCGVDRGTKRNLSCGEICGRKLECGNHACEEICHDGPCPKCPLQENVKCLCGQSTKEVPCGEGGEVSCADGVGNSWLGRYQCELSCQIPFDCGNHTCQSSCHPPHEHRPCPLSPSLVTTCPCGAHPIARSTPTETSLATPTTLPARSSCLSPIPTCDMLCNKLLPGCDHACAAKCHVGPCPPCEIPVVRPCRCGATIRSVSCSSLSEPKEILCEKPCMALRACGKHECRRQCCPLASLASGAGKKGKKRAIDAADAAFGTERGGLHECDLVCGKLLGCGLHPCEERDHKGACPPCLRSSFEELVCHCGRTVLEPPIPCGTQIRCSYQCTRPPPPCGHPQSQHACHEDPKPCPPCPFLADKKCACGKKEISNVKCSLEMEKVSCGTICGKLMDCGFHHCERTCHAGWCGPCTAPCGKPRKLCLPAAHPCIRPCHAPSACPEDKPCNSLVVLTCPCGRIKQSIPCRRKTNAPSAPQHTKPKCNNECAIAQRNAKLASALGVTAESREKAAAVKYHDGLVSFARADGKFLAVVEKAFEDFVTSSKKTQMLPPMPPDRRKFVHDLASIYRMDADMIDQEPNRSVRIIRRLDTSIPKPILSQSIPPPAAAPNLGKLVDYRKAATPASSSWRPSPTPSLPKSTATGWATPSPSPRPTSAAGGTSTTAQPAPEPSRRTASPGTTRTANPAHRQISSVHVPTSPVNVPDNWEDD